MTSLKIINQKELKSWAKEFFLEHNYKMIDVSDKQPTFRKALATGKIIVGKETFELIQSEKINWFKVSLFFSSNGFQGFFSGNSQKSGNP